MTGTLFQSNLEELGDLLGPNLVQALQNLPQGQAYLQGSLEGGDLNGIVGGGPIYPGDALSAAAEQVAEYEKAPARLFGRRPVYEEEEWQRLFGTKRVHESVIEALYDELGDAPLSAEPKSADGGFLISFGLGLGIHIPLLLDKYPVRNLIIVEPNLELLSLSLQVIYWEGVRKKLEDQGGSLTFLISDQPEAAAAELVHLTRSRDYALYDGSYMFLHYDSAYLQALLQGFQDLLPTRLNAMGFFEDECLMLGNSLGNLRRQEIGLLENRVKAPRDLPVFIIASGPSLDGAIENLRANRDHAIFISCGTGLSALLANDIVPDFHCEVENMPFIHDVLQSLPQCDQMKKVTLIAPTTVDPRLADLFGAAIFNFRDSVTPTRIFADDSQVIAFGGPTVTNMACRAALGFGFGEIYMFGVDMGAVEKGRHHSEKSIYYTDGSELMESGLGLADFTIQQSANFGGVAFTNRIFIFSKSYLERLLTLKTNQVVHNCSDGVRIEGTDPLRADQVAIPQTARAAAVRSDIEADHACRDILADPQKLRAFTKSAEEWLAAVRVICEDDGVTDVMALHDRLRPLLMQGHGDQDGGPDAAARVFLSGSLFMILQSLFYLARRVPDDKGTVLVARCKQELASQLDVMAKQTEALLD